MARYLSLLMIRLGGFRVILRLKTRLRDRCFRLKAVYASEIHVKVHYSQRTGHNIPGRP